MDWISSATSVSSCSRLGGLVADFRVAIVSLAASIGPPGSASEIARPATKGPRTILVHSSSVKVSFVVMWCLPLGWGTHEVSARRKCPRPTASPPESTSNGSEAELDHRGQHREARDGADDDAAGPQPAFPHGSLLDQRVT